MGVLGGCACLRARRCGSECIALAAQLAERGTSNAVDLTDAYHPISPEALPTIFHLASHNTISSPHNSNMPDNPLTPSEHEPSESFMPELPRAKSTEHSGTAPTGHNPEEPDAALQDTAEPQAALVLARAPHHAQTARFALTHEKYHFATQTREYAVNHQPITLSRKPYSTLRSKSGTYSLTFNSAPAIW